MSIMNLNENNSNSQVEYLKNIEGIKPFADRIKEIGFYSLKSNRTISTLQVNVGKVCNLMCKHCHVEAGPHRTESMNRDIMFQCLKMVADNHIPTLDLSLIHISEPTRRTPIS